MATEGRAGVLIPRPRRAPDRFVELLERAGFEPRVLPVLEIVPKAEPALGRRLSAALQSADTVIFVSGNAVDSCLALLAAGGADLPADGHYLAVGRATAEALQRYGIAADFPSGRVDSEGLLTLPALRRPAGRRILICRGRGGREKLAGELAARGAAVDILELYDRVPTAANGEAINRLIDAGEIGTVAIHSGEILEAFLDCVEPRNRDRLRGLTFLVPGRRIAALVAERGLNGVLVAASALPEQMVEALVRWYTQNQVLQ